MSDPSPRRRRSSTPPPSPPARGGGSLPTIALAVGVVVAGLGIGALISAYRDRMIEPPVVPLASAPPLVTPVAPPTAIELGPSPTASAAATPSPVTSASPQPTPAASATPLPSPTATATATATPRATPTPSPRPSPTATAHATASPAALPTARPTPSPRPSPTAAAPSRPPAAATMSDAAQGVVRRYLNALMAGNEDAAYAALGGTSSQRGLELKEEAFLDPGARIDSIRTRRSDATSATVDVEIVANSGTYVATYHVTTGPNGPYIDAHDYIRD